MPLRKNNGAIGENRPPEFLAGLKIAGGNAFRYGFFQKGEPRFSSQRLAAAPIERWMKNENNSGQAWKKSGNGITNRFPFLKSSKPVSDTPMRS